MYAIRSKNLPAAKYNMMQRLKLLPRPSSCIRWGCLRRDFLAASFLMTIDMNGNVRISVTPRFNFTCLFPYASAIASSISLSQHSSSVGSHESFVNHPLATKREHLLQRQILVAFRIRNNGNASQEQHQKSGSPAPKQEQVIRHHWPEYSPCPHRQRAVGG